MAIHISRIAINHFRGIRDLEVESLNHINITEQQRDNISDQQQLTKSHHIQLWWLVINKNLNERLLSQGRACA